MKNKNKCKTKISIKVKKPKLRNDWGKVKPYTKVEPDKTKYDRKKYKSIDKQGNDINEN